MAGAWDFSTRHLAPIHSGSRQVPLILFCDVHGSPGRRAFGLGFLALPHLALAMAFGADRRGASAGFHLESPIGAVSLLLEFGALLYGCSILL